MHDKFKADCVDFVVEIKCEELISVGPDTAGTTAWTVQGSIWQFCHIRT